MDKSARLAIASMFREVELASLARDLHKNGESGFEPMFPFDLESQAIGIKPLAIWVICNAQDWNDILH
jgi:hypothetical protein